MLIATFKLEDEIIENESIEDRMRQLLVRIIPLKNEIIKNAKVTKGCLLSIILIDTFLF